MAQLVCFLTNFLMVHRVNPPGRQSPLRAVRQPRTVMRSKKRKAVVWCFSPDLQELGVCFDVFLPDMDRYGG